VIRVVTTAPLSEGQQAAVLAFVENDPNFGACQVSFELGDFLEVDVPTDPAKYSELFGASVLAFVSYYFSAPEGGAA